MSTKKLLIHEDKAAIEKSIYCLEQFIPELSILKTEFENLKIGSFTNEIFNLFKEDKGQSIVKMYYDSVNKELDKVGIENTITRTSLIKAHESTIELFKEKVKQFFNSLYTPFGVVELNLLEYQNNKFVIAKDSINSITERNRYYLETKQEIELFEALTELFKATEKTKKVIVNLIGYELPEHIKTNDLIKDYFIKEYSNKLTFEPIGIRNFKYKFRVQ